MTVPSWLVICQLEMSMWMSSSFREFLPFFPVQFGECSSVVSWNPFHGGQFLFCLWQMTILWIKIPYKQWGLIRIFICKIYYPSNVGITSSWASLLIWNEASYASYEFSHLENCIDCIAFSNPPNHSTTNIFLDRMDRVHWVHCRNNLQFMFWLEHFQLHIRPLTLPCAPWHNFGSVIWLSQFFLSVWGKERQAVKLRFANMVTEWHFTFFRKENFKFYFMFDKMCNTLQTLDSFGSACKYFNLSLFIGIGTFFL